LETNANFGHTSQSTNYATINLKFKPFFFDEGLMRELKLCRVGLRWSCFDFIAAATLQLRSKQTLESNDNNESK
jgi:hypothetical protein